MSKAVKSVGRSISKVVKGVTSAVKKVASSKIGKVLLVAAAVYFGGAALMGGLSGSAAGTGFLSGASQGIANAWSGLTAAGSSAMAGNFSQAGSQLAAGFQGQAAAGGSALAGSGASGMTQAQMLTAQNAGIPGATELTNAAAKTAFPAGAGASGAGTQLALTPGSNPGLISGAWNGLGDRAKAAVITGSMQVGGGMLQGMDQRRQLEDQRDYEQQQAQAARDRYNANVGTNWWSGSGAAADASYANAPVGGAIPRPGLVSGAMTAGPAPGQTYQDYMNNMMRSYNPYALRTA